jgi:DNA-binding winged helix-turn-helix (wHTH) protein
MDRKCVFTFGKENGQNFRLEVTETASGKLHLSLMHGSTALSGVSRQALETLKYMLEHPGKFLTRDEILEEVSPASDHNLIDRYVSTLRQALSSRNEDLQKYITTVDGGYLLPGYVSQHGDLGVVRGYSQWNRLRFQEMVASIARGPDTESEDVRLLITHMGASFFEALDLKVLMRRKIRVRAVILNPKNTVLINARYAPRTDMLKDKLLRDVDEQAHEVAAFAQKNPVSPNNGSFEYRVSDLMPCGFVLHTRKWAIVGLFLAHTVYTDGPLFEIHAGSEAWEQLRLDWQARWNAPSAVR